MIWNNWDYGTGLHYNCSLSSLSLSLCIYVYPSVHPSIWVLTVMTVYTSYPILCCQSLSTGRHDWSSKLFTYVNNWVRSWAHSHLHHIALFLSSELILFGPADLQVLLAELHSLHYYLISPPIHLRGKNAEAEGQRRLNIVYYYRFLSSLFKPDPARSRDNELNQNPAFLWYLT